MTPEEIKKELYRRNPYAKFVYAQNKYLHYRARLVFLDSADVSINFAIPFIDMGDSKFEASVAAKHLIRYMVIPENQTTNGLE